MGRKRKQQAYEKEAVIACPYCKGPVARTDYQGHIRKHHPEHALDTGIPISASTAAPSTSPNRSRRREPQPTPILPKRLIICDICGDSIPANEIRKHDEKHTATRTRRAERATTTLTLNQDSKTQRTKKKQKKGKSPYHCPLCDEAVARVFFVEHVKQDHRRVWEKVKRRLTWNGDKRSQWINLYMLLLPLKSSIKAASKPRVQEKSLRKCPYCNISVHERNLKKHIREKCPAKKGKKNNTITPTSDIVTESQRMITGCERKMDATKDYAHPMRDYGSQFGSHPSHDNFSDEGSP